MAEKNDWKSSILTQIQKRNQRETLGFEQLVKSHSRLATACDALKSQNLQLTLEAERLRQLGADRQAAGDNLIGNVDRNPTIIALEQKIYKLQEDLTDSLRRKGENAQKIIDLNNLLQEKEKEITRLTLRVVELEAFEKKGLANIKALDDEIEGHKRTIAFLRDEQQVLQIEWSTLNEKWNKLQKENQTLVQRWMEKKNREADMLNLENEQIVKKQEMKILKDLEDAAKEQNPIGLLPSSESDMDDGSSMLAYGYTVTIPTKVSHHFVAHDGEVNSVRFGPGGKVLATGGADRKVKLWKEEGGKADLIGTLTGSNASVMSLDFDSEETFILAASDDFASRIWCLSDQRLRHTLTGHSGKVKAARFLGDSTKVVSGSHDRTLKLWDLKSKACIRTIFAGSSCNDLVTSDAVATNIISGHFDKRIRFWDTRTENSSSEISLQGKITSLDLHPDRVQLLACSRDDTIKMIDLRMNQVCATFCAEGFKTCCDWTRAAFSPDGQYVSVGSQDDNVYIWNASSQKLEKTLKEHSHAVVAVHWHPAGNKFISCDKNKNCVLWTDY